MSELIGQIDFYLQYEEEEFRKQAVEPDIAIYFPSPPAQLLGKCKSALEQATKDKAELVEILHKVDDLMTDSVGVAGLHMNGDLAPWDSLLTGGFFEDWLLGFTELVDKHPRKEPS